MRCLDFCQSLLMADVVKDASKRDAVLSSVIADVYKGKKLSKNVNFPDCEEVDLRMN